MASWTDIAFTKSVSVRALHGWWHGARRRDAVPDRKDFDPVDHRPLLPNILISEAEPHPFRIRYRLVGTRVVAIAGFDFTGCYLDELLSEHPREPWPEFYAAAIATRLPVLGGVSEPTVTGGQFYYEFGIFPVTAGGGAVEQFICVEDYFGSNLISAGLRPWLNGR